MIRMLRVWLAAGLLGWVAAAAAQPLVLTGTLAKVRESGTITLGHRESSVPFSYLSPRGEPIGYSIDLCKLLVEAIGEEVGRTLAIRWLPVTSRRASPRSSPARPTSSAARRRTTSSDRSRSPFRRPSSSPAPS